MIQTDRLLLRPLTDADVTEVYGSWFQDPEVLRYLDWRARPTQTQEDILAYVRTQRWPAALLLGLFLKANSRHTGNLRLGGIDWVHRRAEVAFLLGASDLWGHGYMTEAVKGVTQFSFDTLGLHKLRAGCDEGNAASRRVFEKAGWTLEGVLRRELWREGAWRDILQYAVWGNDDARP